LAIREGVKSTQRVLQQILLFERGYRSDLGGADPGLPPTKCCLQRELFKCANNAERAEKWLEINIKKGSNNEKKFRSRRIRAREEHSASRISCSHQKGIQKMDLQ
jgi:hypothetical protein